MFLFSAGDGVDGAFVAESFEDAFVVFGESCGVFVVDEAVVVFHGMIFLVVGLFSGVLCTRLLIKISI